MRTSSGAPIISGFRCVLLGPAVAEGERVCEAVAREDAREGLLAAAVAAGPLM